MTAYTAGQLDERAHRRWLDHGPIVVVVAAHFRHGRTEHDEHLVGGFIPINALAQVGAVKHRFRLATVEHGVQPLLNGRAQQQRKARVVHAQMHLPACGHALVKQRQRHVHQRLDVGHAHQAKADALGAVRIKAVVVGVQRHGCCQYDPGKTCMAGLSVLGVG